MEKHAKIIVHTIVGTIVPDHLLVLFLTTPKKTAVCAEKEKKLEVVYSSIKTFSLMNIFSVSYTHLTLPTILLV